MVEPSEAPKEMDEEEMAEHCLMLSQQLFQEGRLDAEQRDLLKCKWIH